MEPVTTAFLIAGGAVAYRYFKRGRKHEEWKLVIQQAAERLGGRASTGSRFDAPELRATLDQITVNLKIKAAHKKDDKGVAIAEASVSKDAEKVRMYFGWDISTIRRELEYIPKVDDFNVRGLTGRLNVRADDAQMAKAFLHHAVNDISDVRREAGAHGLEVLVRGGTLRIAVHGVDTSPEMIERLAIATTRLVRGIDHFAGDPGGPAPAVAPLPSPGTGVECTLCVERKRGDEAWVRCNRCQAPYHRTCWVQATGCLTDGCHETRATPI